MGKPCSCTQFIKKLYFLRQVTRESVSGTTSHVRASEHAMKLKVRMIKSQALPEKNNTQLLPLAMLLVLHTRNNTYGNNTDSNKVVIFSGIAWYYGDTYHTFKGAAHC